MTLNSDDSFSDQNSSKTVSEALTLLHSLKPRVMEILGKDKLRVALNRMDIMKPNRGSQDKLDNAHVLWIGPAIEGDEALKLQAVGGASRTSCCGLHLHCGTSDDSEIIHR